MSYYGQNIEYKEKRKQGEGYSGEELSHIQRQAYQINSSVSNRNSKSKTDLERYKFSRFYKNNKAPNSITEVIEFRA